MTKPPRLFGFPHDVEELEWGLLLLVVVFFTRPDENGFFPRPCEGFEYILRGEFELDCRELSRVPFASNDFLFLRSAL